MGNFTENKVSKRTIIENLGFTHNHYSFHEIFWTENGDNKIIKI